jgi:16S rRNA (cytidine1402-2'-O)-methyltransferase
LKLPDTVAWLKSYESNQRGKFVLILSRPSTGEAIEAEIAQTQALERTFKILLEDLPLKQAVALAVKLTGRRRIWFMGSRCE